MDKNLEIAKSFFTLSQILGVIAGLFLIASGTFSMPLDDYYRSQNGLLDFCKDISGQDNTYFQNCIGKINDVTEFYNISKDYSLFLFIQGLMTGLLSLKIWIIGYSKIINESFNDLLSLVTVFSIYLLIIINSGIVILFS